MIRSRVVEVGSTVVEPVRFGLVGYGFGGRYFHAPLLAAAVECDLVAVATSSAERRELLRQEHPGVTAVGSLPELAAAGVEAVAISTPADTHTALTDQALDLGLAVVCDKPFALDAPAARATAERARRLGLPLAPYQNRRWDSDFRTVQALAEAGTLGTITRFESRFERFTPEPGPAPSGGGTLLDFGSHLVDQALVLLGPVSSVYAEWRVRESGLDDDVFVALTHAGGARSHLAGSWSEGAPGNRFRVTGTAGSYVVGGPMDGQEEALVAGETPATRGPEWGAEPEARWGRVRRGDHEYRVPTLPGAWDTFYPAFAAAVRGLGAVPVEPQDAVASLTVLDAARRSATEGVVVRLG
ncbi:MULTISPECIES: Gfo/Idh/MocA family protein [unclassified Modestobacter]|uniref:Gfo/Idh/MocA family protein n=1 Tax=unclassified Modestobacter TaxID=2643866 RepID=UPI0022AAC992|nr:MULTISPECIES: Gfo/Idh/MocA family oxidoreductase [unclassified Modestobacter]MCZ2823969.1 Gfo/Idh/MocA family oxidoreductase [Modestobacter sp. VKM Ac-2981]MCZ2852214.1 Gfo/Idh/MocA family oxidoreductase [Modestobacter sp. VKM Ac-2982]